MLEIFGHTVQRESLGRLFKIGKLPTTMMFTGPAGVGKGLVALELARGLLCRNKSYGGCSKCDLCTLFDKGNLPDLHQVHCLDRETWNIAKLRELLYTLNLRPFSSTCRVVVFHDAEQLTLQSANLLLKTLEEPRPDTYFILVSGNHSKLPGTVTSRCQIWFFDTLDQHEISKVLSKRYAGQSELDFDELALLADGSAANLDTILMRLDSWRELGQALKGIFLGDLKTGSELAKSLSAARDDLRDKLHIMRIYARKEMRAATTPEDSSRWAVLVSNLISAERLIFDRNISANNLLNLCFLNLGLDDSSGQFTTLTNDVTLVEQLIV